jgi:mannose-6-phosphate isomerase
MKRYVGFLKQALHAMITVNFLRFSGGCEPSPILMTELTKSRGPSRAAVIEMQSRLCAWLRDDALPLWDRHGIDRLHGGFYEEISAVGPQLSLAAEGRLRRGRVVARQIYVFDIGERLGWRPGIVRPVDHGCDYLFTHMHAGDGHLHTSVDGISHAPQMQFSLYEQAFYLFALARLQTAGPSRFPIEKTAIRCLERLRAAYGKSGGGFEESQPPGLPLRSNPHMHLLEAALEWIEAASEGTRPIWVGLAQELVSLCLTRFCDNATGMIREYFDSQWRPVDGVDGRVLEPGHQFEWGWLLIQWASLPHADAPAQCLTAARRLIDAGERWGVDPRRGVAINEMWDDMTVKDDAAKLWPQTERVKAWCARLLVAATEAEAEYACDKIVMAARGMTKYLREDVPGLWYENYSAEGTFSSGPTKASSLYHLACAIHVLGKSVAAVSTGASGSALGSVGSNCTKEVLT